MLGALLAAAVLTRVVGVMLVAAYAVSAAIAFIAGRDRRALPWLALLPVVLLVAAWIVLRPGGHVYGFTLGKVLSAWVDHPANALHTAGVAFSSGWLASFMAEAAVSGIPRFLLFLFGALALAGTLRAVARNRFDGWYVLLSAVLVFFWPFGETQTRRLLYPLVPLAMLHAAEASHATTVAMRIPRPGLVAALAIVLPLLLCIPAIVVIAQKSFDRTPVVPGSTYSPADITEYYTTINRVRARELAARHAAVLGGLERISEDTPAGTRVMWVRPEYVALLGRRAGSASYFDWDAERLAREVRDTNVDFIVIAGVYKPDLDQKAGNPALALQQVEPYAARRLVLSNPLSGYDEFILMAVDRAALDAYLSKGAAPVTPRKGP
jgi:hypothetical protein